MLSEKLVKLPELAAALDRSEDWIKRNWLRQHLEHGMPRKLAIGWSWPRAAMERWLEEGAGGMPRMEPEAPKDSPREHASLQMVIANQNARMRAKYAGRTA